MNRPRPNLVNPAQRASYREELRAFRRGARRGSLVVNVLAVSVLFAATRPAFASLEQAGWVLLTAGVTWTVSEIVRRNRYHKRRMRGEA